MSKLKVVFNKVIGAKGNIYPSTHFLKIVKEIKTKKKNVKIAEIGVDKGATTKEVLKILSKGDQYDLFDVSSCKFFSKIKSIKTDVEIITHANSSKTFDSYGWEIAKILVKNQKESEIKKWDAIYLDGAHTFHVDAGTTACLKEMLNNDGYIIFDDMNWTLKSSPTCNTKFNRDSFTSEQMETPHVKLIVEALIKNDKRFLEVFSEDKSRSIFKKLNN